MTLDYLAGLFDGEGCIGFIWTTLATGNGKKLWYPRVSLTNTFLPILEKIKEEFGGYISVSKKPKGNEKQCYVWSLSNTKALAFIKALAPHLVIKKGQAEYLIENWPTNPNCARLTPEVLAQRAVVKAHLSNLKNVNYQVAKENYN